MPLMPPPGRLRRILLPLEDLLKRAKHALEGFPVDREALDIPNGRDRRLPLVVVEQRKLAKKVTRAK
eukprot:CAMPEP_0205927512 /NCGR_PEP_ID=MMETSP1325-20131115/22758_1 /ASSEMBLY_ACC=CAM_ASM_000708 /TAXON_ID=236786 /ORGANISM="Florenciella sp., Strain RCC1007" /LENGTH=66 /DNA_ID=CAMNT_0053296397 /DNA_START=166 /DNA_END=363 /DNA_ORIENTATION=-